MALLQENRPNHWWRCGVCGKGIQGKANTILLGILSHCRPEKAAGLRPTDRAHGEDREGRGFLPAVSP